MLKITIPVIFVCALFFSCKKDFVLPKDIPACVEERIRKNHLDKNWEVHSVEEYSLEGQLVYIYSQDQEDISDAMVTVFDANCQTVCNLYGIGGFSMCLGVNFVQNAVHTRTIWKAP